MAIDPNIILQAHQVQQPDLVGSYMKIMQLKNLMAQNQQHDLAAQQMQQQMADTRNMRDLAAKHTIIDPATGQQKFDEQGFITDLQAANPTAAASYRKSAYEAQEAQVKMTGQQLATAKQRLDMVNTAYAGLLALPNPTPQDVANVFTSLIKQGVVPPEMADGQMQQIPQDPGQIRSFLLQHAMKQMDASKRMELALGEMKDIKTGGKNVMFNVNKLTGEITPVKELGVDAQSSAGKLEQDISNKIIPDDQIGPYRKKEQTNTAMALAGGGLTLTPDALDMLAKQGLTKGEVPNMGMGTAGTAQRVKIANRMAQMGEDGTLPDLGVKGATYKADAASLSQMQRNRDQIISFERTANANLDQFLSLAAKMPDSGSAWLNTPLRDMMHGMGDVAQAAAQTGLTVLRPEYAKINQGSLNGVLSDSARKEVEKTMPDNATFGQYLAAAKVLKQDAANRHKFFDEAIEEIKGRIGVGKPGSSKANPVAVADEAAYNALAPGSWYKAKDGSIGRKP